MSLHCEDKQCNHTSSLLYSQSLDELEFERGIWQASIDGNLQKIRSLLLKGTDVNSRDTSGYTALLYAARNGHIDIVDYLIKQGACVNCCTKTGEETPLHRAAYMGHLEIAKQLVSNGANLNCQNADGQTCLHKSVQSGQSSMANYLLSISPLLDNIKDRKGKLPSEYSKISEQLH